MMNTTMSEMSKASEITTTSEKHIQTSGCVCAPANCEPKRRVHRVHKKRVHRVLSAALPARLLSALRLAHEHARTEHA